MYFLRKIILHFPSKGKISYFTEKDTIFPDNTRKIIFQRDLFWKDHLFGVFEKEISSIQIIQKERSYFSTIF